MNLYSFQENVLAWIEEKDKKLFLVFPADYPPSIFSGKLYGMILKEELALFNLLVN